MSAAIVATLQRSSLVRRPYLAADIVSFRRLGNKNCVNLIRALGVVV